MMVNEPSIYEEPNCLLYDDCLIVVEPILKGQYLKAQYMNSYEPIRKKMGYSTNTNFKGYTGGSLLMPSRHLNGSVWHWISVG